MAPRGLTLIAVLALAGGTAACSPPQAPASAPLPTPSESPLQTLPLPSLRELGTPQPPATVRPIASP